MKRRVSAAREPEHPGPRHGGPPPGKTLTIEGLDRGPGVAYKTALHAAARPRERCRLDQRSENGRDSKYFAGVAQSEEQLPCKQQVAGSSPTASSSRPAQPENQDGETGSGGVPERPKGADCKSAGIRLRWFESTPLHQESSEAPARGNSSVGRASAFQAECRGFESRFPLNRRTGESALLAQSAERVLGKDEVSSSILEEGSSTAKVRRPPGA